MQSKTPAKESTALFFCFPSCPLSFTSFILGYFFLLFLKDEDKNEVILERHDQVTG
jgi:hypothetical protein